MRIGIVGAPNKGKSTLFSALTSIDVGIADYAFTTIEPNMGMAYARHECADRSLGVKCNPRNSGCEGGTRMIPVNIIDVAGLVPGAHMGRGRGNQFLNDLIGADVLVQVVDASGRTDEYGSACTGCDPAKEVGMVRAEIVEWLAGIIARHRQALSKRDDGEAALHELLSGMNVDLGQIQRAAEASFVSLSRASWDEESTRRFSDALLRENKPVIIAANKCDVDGGVAPEKISAELGGAPVVGCAAAIELALVKAAAAGMIDYVPGSGGFAIKGNPGPEQKSALKYMQSYLERNASTGVQKLLDTAVFGLLENIVVYPVEDETHYTDHSGNVLPDAILMKNGSTAHDLASRIHSEIAKGMKYAVDARSKMRLQKDYRLRDLDVIKIVGTR